MKKRVLSFLLVFFVISIFFSAAVLAEGNDAAEFATTVYAAEDVKAVIADLNANGGEKTIILGQDITLPQNDRLEIKKGTLTLLGGGHTLKVGSITIIGDGITVNLGKEDGSDTLTLTTENEINCLISVNESAVLNMYEGVTVTGSAAMGQAGGIALEGTSVFNMYGGTIQDCTSISVAGGVHIVNTATFNMYGGVIQRCTGMQGGGVGFDGAPIGGSTYGSATFNMYDGEIKDCKEEWLGGGGISAYTASPITVNINGGKITSCIGGGSGYGGAVFVYATHSDSVVKINSGEIFGNSAQYGGGIFAYGGNITIADGVAIYNNTAEGAGDDIYCNGEVNFTVGQVGSNLKLSSTNHIIDGWYHDMEPRYNHDDPDTITPYENVGVLDTSEFALKAAHKKIIPVEDINLNLEDKVIELKEKQLTLIPTITPENATNPNLVWASSDEEIATVQDGVVTLIKRGVVTITAVTEDGGHEASAVVTIICSHEFGEWVVVKEPTAAEEGLKERVCSICGDKETDTIPATGAENPPTGDTPNPVLWAVLVIISAAGIAAVIRNTRKLEK